MYMHYTMAHTQTGKGVLRVLEMRSGELQPRARVGASAWPYG